jgi:hypothetical protein
MPFYRFLEKLAIGLSDQTDQISWVTLNWLRALSKGKPLIWSFWVRTQTCTVITGLVR